MVKETFRGWQGHWCCKAHWHLNTLLDFGNKKFVVSTNGNGFDSLNNKFTLPAGGDFMFETMVFESDYSEWDDPNVRRQDCEFTKRYEEEKDAQQGHYEVIELVKQKYA